jgi:VIT1/CCC1 family predicted Fe2+/Mn2+ transporter
MSVSSLIASFIASFITSFTASKFRDINPANTTVLMVGAVV